MDSFLHSEDEPDLDLDKLQIGLRLAFHKT